MNIQELEIGKCYKKSSASSICLFKLNKWGWDQPEYKDEYWKHAMVTEIIILKQGIQIVEEAYLSPYEEFEETDESILDKAIKYFNMSKAAISVIINQDKSNETQRNTTQGDYQLP